MTEHQDEPEPAATEESPEKEIPSREIDMTGPVGRPIEEMPFRLGSSDWVGNLIAIVIIGTFSLSIVLCFVFTFLRFLKQPSECLDDAFELFKTVSAVLSGPLGFVLGFYFRQRLIERRS